MEFIFNQQNFFMIFLGDMEKKPFFIYERAKFIEFLFQGF